MRKVVCALIGVMLVGGCTSPDSGTEEVRLTQVDGMPTADVDDTVWLEWAESTLAGECMVARGYPFWAQWRARVRKNTEPDQLYGIADVTWVTAHGYGIGERRSAPDVTPEDPNTRYLHSLPKERWREYDTAYHGTEQDRITVTLANGMTASMASKGCLAEARTKLFGSLPDWLRLDTSWRNIDAEIAPTVLKDARYLKALAGWRACMAGRGQQVAEPMALREQVSREYSLKPRTEARELEMALAKLEAECAQTTALIRTAEEVHAEVRAGLDTTRKSDLDTYREMMRTALDAARKLAGPA
ncbi:hypothetical protein ACFQZ4_25785 [Catellatospora coxensis]|uniref:Uncharacterized protein n=1 Tax=Catellatospora coxensis TaxID=310354 RepID=A0A8J3L5R3_9ACTN|nr:hypothetical protein [Catellatospora coxensis]GIG08335.1 hypothetical protein Cco03nite_50350 [Catellatospora coxensis]